MAPKSPLEPISPAPASTNTASMQAPNHPFNVAQRAGHDQGSADAPGAAASEPPRRRSSTTADADDLPIATQDAIFQHQIMQPRPLSITPQTLIAAGICSWPKDAANVHHALVKAGVLETEREQPRNHRPRYALLGLGFGGSQSSSNNQGDFDGDENDFLPATAHITSALPKQLRVLSVAAVKMLVKVLFFWEEEISRWRARDLDIAALEKALEGYVSERALLDQPKAQEGPDTDQRTEEKARLEKMADEVRFRIEATRLRRLVKPSARNIDAELPQYEGRH